MPVENKRLNYFNGQFLVAEDFIDEQTYHMSMRRHLNRKLHAVGIADGLIVTRENDQAIRVTAGTAIDSAGREIVLAADSIKSISTTGDATRYVTIRYDDHKDDPPEPHSTEYTRYIEEPIIEIPAGTPADAGQQLVLAVVHIVGGVIQEPIEEGEPPNHRRLTGEKAVIEYVARKLDTVNERIIQDRRQFVPLLAFSLKGVEYKNGRNATIPVGGQPKWLTFDGTHIWFTTGESILNKIDVAINEVDPNPITISGYPSGMVFDGTYMWLPIPSSDQVLKVNMALEIVIRIVVDPNPNAIAFDGRHMWIAHSGEGKISKINVETNDVDPNTISIPDEVHSMAFDGTHMWATSEDSFDVYKINATNNGFEEIKVDYHSGSIAFDGAYMWVSRGVSSGGGGQKSLFKIDVATDSIVELDIHIKRPGAISFDGQNIWITGSKGSSGRLSVHKIDVTTNEIVANINMNDPRELVFDGTHLWVAESSNISKILI